MSPHQHIHNILWRVLTCLLEPTAQRFKCSFLEYVVNEEHSRGIAIEISDYRPETLLPSGIPNLQLDGVDLVNFDHFGSELDTDGDAVLRIKVILDIPHHEAALTGGRLSDDYDLEQQLVRCLPASRFHVS